MPQSRIVKYKTTLNKLDDKIDYIIAAQIYLSSIYYVAVILGYWYEYQSADKEDQVRFQSVVLLITGVLVLTKIALFYKKTINIVCRNLRRMQHQVVSRFLFVAFSITDIIVMMSCFVYYFDFVKYKHVYLYDLYLALFGVIVIVIISALNRIWYRVKTKI